MLNKCKSLKKYNDWCLQPLNYDFNRIFIYVSVIYILSTFYDLSLTYITFRLSPNNFFRYEFSFIIKKAYGGDLFFCILVIVLFIAPL